MPSAAEFRLRTRVPVAPAYPPQGKHSPVDYAAFLGHADVLAALVRAGGKPSTDDEGGLGLLKYLACTDQVAAQIAQKQGSLVAAMTVTPPPLRAHLVTTQ